jgi:hypothetical protein
MVINHGRHKHNKYQNLNPIGGQAPPGLLGTYKSDQCNQERDYHHPYNKAQQG